MKIHYSDVVLKQLQKFDKTTQKRLIKYLGEVENWKILVVGVKL